MSIDKGTVRVIRRMSNKSLIQTINKIRHEKAHPEIYSKKYGTTRWVTDSEFYGGHHKVLKDELKKRQNQGIIKKSAGKSKKSRSQNMGFGFQMPKINFGI